MRNQIQMGLVLTLLLLPMASLFAEEEQAAGATAETTEAAGTKEEEAGFWAQFKDPEDGKFDMSAYLLEKFAGFMPVPIIITEPAVEDGLGLAGIFFHKPKEDQMKPDENGKVILPNISVVGAGITGNDSWFVGGGHFRNWKKDKYRYRGFGGYADVNLDWYPSDDSLLPGNGIGFNIKGAMLDQSLFMRMGESQWLLGAGWRYTTSELKFDINLPPGLFSGDSSISGLSAIALYENVDFQMSPRKGLTFELTSTFNRDAFGSDFDYDEIAWEYRHYIELGEKWTLSWRVDGATISGDAPFYAQPFVKIQGIPAMRYQGPTAATIEVRGGYDLTPRWTLNAFTGGGRAADSFSDLSDATTHSSVGAGFRYLIAKALGMRVGIDVATSEEGTYFYLVMGSAW